MNGMNFKPFISKLLDSLSDEELRTLFSLITRHSNNFKNRSLINASNLLTASDKGIGLATIQLDLNTIRSGYLIYNDTYCVLLSYISNSEKITEYEIDMDKMTYQVVKEFLTTDYLRLEVGIRGRILNVKQGQYVVVDTEEYPTLDDFLDSDGEQGTVYLYPVGNQANNYYQYIWETGRWVPLGSTEINLDNVVTVDGDQTITGIKTFSNGIKSNTLAAVSGDIHIAAGSGGAVNFEDPVWHKGTFYPYTADIYSLGSSEYRYANIFTKQFSIANGTTIWYVKNDQYNEILIESPNGKRIVNLFDTGTGASDIQGMYLGGNLVAPLENGILDLGQTGRRFKSLYTEYLDTKDLNTKHLKVNVDNDNTYATFETKHNDPVLLFKYGIGSSASSLVIPVKNIVYNPIADGTKDLGTSTKRFRNVYVQRYLSNGARSITIADIQEKITITDNGDNTIDVTIPTR